LSCCVGPASSALGRFLRHRHRRPSQPVRIADQGCHSPGVEDAIKITTGGLGDLGVFDHELAGIVRSLQTFGSVVRLLEQDGVALCSSCALGNEPERDLPRVNGGVSETPAEDLSSYSRL
jgi:hypothetical protein